MQLREQLAEKLFRDSRTTFYKCLDFWKMNWVVKNKYLKQADEILNKK